MQTKLYQLHSLKTVILLNSRVQLLPQCLPHQFSLIFQCSQQVDTQVADLFVYRFSMLLLIEKVDELDKVDGNVGNHIVFNFVLVGVAIIALLNY